MERKNRNTERDSRREDFQTIDKIDRLLIDIQKKLRSSNSPVCLENLTAFERKKIHSFFDTKADFQTKTYRDNDMYILKIFPVGNLKRLAEEKCKLVLDTGQSVFLENLSNYERFIIHDHLKNFEGIETISSGEGNSRRLEIKPKRFGRSLKKIMKKIKIF